VTVYPFNRHASYAETQRTLDLISPRTVGRQIDNEHELLLQSRIRRWHARADARAHVRRLLEEARQLRADMFDARKRRYYAVRYFEENYLSAARDCWEAFRARNTS
jgi:hypothetical protein